MTTKTMSEKAKAFKKIHDAYKRALDSKQYTYWQDHTQENCDGWGFKRMFPHTTKSEEMSVRVCKLEDEALELYRNATEEEKDEMDAIDECHLTEGC